MRAVVPLLPCRLLPEILDFYRALGFEVTHEQESPYMYGAVQRGEVELHFSHLPVYGEKNMFGAVLVFVPDVAIEHQAFANGLRSAYKTIPTAGLPRLTRLKKGHTRFTVFDPRGNMIVYINSDEPEIDYEASSEALSDLEAVLENAAFLRDTYTNDKAAAGVLDKALARHKDANPLDRARAWAARTELAVAMGEMDHAQRAREALAKIALTEEDREHFRDELHAADDLERWIGRERN